MEDSQFSDSNDDSFVSPCKKLKISGNGDMPKNSFESEPHLGESNIHDNINSVSEENEQSSMSVDTENTRHIDGSKGKDQCEQSKTTATAEVTVNHGTEEINMEEELQMQPHLREFDILDDYTSEKGDDGEQSSSGSSVTDSDLPEEEVEAMLEEALPEGFKGSRKKIVNKEEGPVKLKEKVALVEIGHDHFDLLPEGWIKVIHSSGMPVYLHKKSRVCTMSRPYYLGPGSTRNHKVPLSAIPCLQYKRALEVEKKLEEERSKMSEKKPGEFPLITARIETTEENEAAQSLEITDLREYCKKVFNFKTHTFVPFKTWSERRKFAKKKKEERRQRPTLPVGTKLLKFPIQNPDGSGSHSKGEWIINPNGKSYVCILHEYVQQVLKKQPTYEFKELENPATPYSATVFIGEMQYGTATGTSKKLAKVEAAKATLEVLIPEMREKVENDKFGTVSSTSQNSHLSIFDEIGVEDPRVTEFCAKTTEPPPYTILLTCLKRNIGLGDVQVKYEMNALKKKENEFTMSVGKHTAKVICKNKREGKHRAAQAILQALHPNVNSWGSLLRMYGNSSVKNAKEKKQEEHEITVLQSRASLNSPNFAILNKLREEMTKLNELKSKIKSIGKFIPPEEVVLPSLSTTDLNKVNLA